MIHVSWGHTTTPEPIGSRWGRCLHCDAEARLTSYAARELVKIMLVPITAGHIRLVDACSECKRSRRIRLEEATREAEVERETSSFEEAWRRRDPAAGIAIAKALIACRCWSRAEAHLGRLASNHSRNSDVHALVGEYCEAQGRMLPAAEAYEKALALAPGEERHAASLARCRERVQGPRAAEEGYRALLAKRPNHAPYLSALAACLSAQGKHDEAVAAFDRLYALHPLASHEPAILEAAARSRRAAGGFPNAAEERAEQAALARRRKSRNRNIVVWLLVSLSLVLLLGLAAAVGLYQNRTVRIVVDNRMPAPCALALDGAPWLEIRPDAWVDKRIPRGVHELLARAGGREERVELHVEPPLIANLQGYTIVCDPFRMGVYEESEVVYGHGTPRRRRLHSGEQSFSLERIDDLFTEPPETVELRHGTSQRRIVLRRKP